MITSRLRGSGLSAFAVVTIAGTRIGSAAARIGPAANDNARPLRFIADHLAPESPRSESPESDPHLAAWLAAIREKLDADSDLYRAAFSRSGPTLAELARSARCSAIGFDRDGERMELVNLLEKIGALTPSRTIPE